MPLFIAVDPEGGYTTYFGIFDGFDWSSAGSSRGGTYCLRVSSGVRVDEGARVAISEVAAVPEWANGGTNASAVWVPEGQGCAGIALGPEQSPTSPVVEIQTRLLPPGGSEPTLSAGVSFTVRLVAPPQDLNL